MASTETILSILSKRGARRSPLHQLYRNLYNPEFFEMAYGKIYRNAGAMTRGVTQETADGMSEGKIRRIIDELRQGEYHWSPVRRMEIPKANGKTRPLGIPTWSDKLVQEALRTLLDAYYEPRFSDLSHGFRPHRSCHTALMQIQKTWIGTTWFIEGDIQGCFDNIDHEILLKIIGEDIKDDRVLKLVRQLLQAGYMKDWKWHDSTSGSPQGGIISPLLANIYMNKLDEFVEGELIPAYTKGKGRARNPVYANIMSNEVYARRTGNAARVKQCRTARSQIPVYDMADPDFRRLKYARYADDFLLGFQGPKNEAEAIKQRIESFLRDELKLTLSADKTLITHGRTDKVKFLGHEIQTIHAENGGAEKQRNGKICLLMPQSVEKKIEAKYCRLGKPEYQPWLLQDQDLTIINRYQSVLRGLYNFYCLAHNVSNRMDRISWVLRASLLKTLACKHKRTVTQIARKLTVNPPGRPVELRAFLPREGKDPMTAAFGGISFARRKTPLGVGEFLLEAAWLYRASQRVELIDRLKSDTCEVCEGKGDIQVHHIRKLSDLKRPGRSAPTETAKRMAARRRKTLVVCGKCHRDIHAGKQTQRPLKSLESRVRRKSQARFGEGGTEKC